MPLHKTPQPKQAGKVNRVLKYLNRLWLYSSKDQTRRQMAKPLPKLFLTPLFNHLTTWSWCKRSSVFKWETQMELKNLQLVRQVAKIWKWFRCRIRLTRKMQKVWTLDRLKLIRPNRLWPHSKLIIMVWRRNKSKRKIHRFQRVQLIQNPVNSTRVVLMNQKN